MKATKTQLNQALKCESVSQLNDLINGIALEKDLRKSEEKELAEQLRAEFNKSRTRLAWRVAESKQGVKWLNVYVQTKRSDGTFSEIGKFTPKLLNVTLAEAKNLFGMLSTQIDSIVEEASK